jgi:hypothetical protein
VGWEVHHVLCCGGQTGHQTHQICSPSNCQDVGLRKDCKRRRSVSILSTIPCILLTSHREEKEKYFHGVITDTNEWIFIIIHIDKEMGSRYWQSDALEVSPLVTDMKSVGKVTVRLETLSRILASWVGTPLPGGHAHYNLLFRFNMVWSHWGQMILLAYLISRTL